MAINVPVWVFCVIIVAFGMWVMGKAGNGQWDGPAGCIPYLIGMAIIAGGIIWLAID